MDATMTRKSDRPKAGPGEAPKRPAPDGPKKSSGSGRPKGVTTVNLYRDEAAWAKELGGELDMNITEYLSSKIRSWLREEYLALLDRKARRAQEEGPPGPAK